MSNARNELVHAEVAYTGTWRIEPIESNESVTFAVHYPPSSSNRSGPIALANLGLTTEALRGQPHPLSFEVRREAGVFVCRGFADGGRGNGAFRFGPDPIYANAVVESGLARLTLHQHIQAGMFEISSSFVKAIVAADLPHVTFSDLIGLKIFRITSEDVNALHINFPRASLDDIRALAMRKVTAGYVEALRRANIGNLSAENVSALRAYGIDQAFIEGLAAKGHHSLSIDDVVGIYGNG